jgi:Predicted sugar phosphatases of the HAD superfamily
MILYQILKGAKDFGIKAIQVKTGKYQNSDCDNNIVQPNARIDSIVDIAELLKVN